MSVKEEVETLRRIPLFANLEPGKLKLLAFTSERLNFAPGEVVFRQGDPGDAAYVILAGDADIMVETPSGPAKVATLTRNMIVGEIAILCDVPRTATVTAASALTVLRIDKETFYRLINEFPAMAIEIMRELAARVERMNVQLREARAAQRA